MRKILNSIGQLVFPKLCVCCEGYLSHQEYLICDICNLTLPKFEQFNDNDNSIVKKFWGRSNLYFATAILSYGRSLAVRNILHEIKYKGNKELGLEMGKKMGRELKNIDALASVNLLVPIPLHPKREMLRGYNQSNLLVKGIKEITNIDVELNSLRRVTHNRSQTRKSRYNRYVNTKDIFKLSNPERFRDKHVLIVDDVITTGSTVESCVDALKDVEGVKLSVLCLAAAN